MKKNVFRLMTALMMAVMCVGFSACGSDDDDGGSGGGNGGVSGGISMSVKQGYFLKDSGSRWELYFISKIPKSDGSFDGVADLLIIDLVTDKSYESIPEGEFQGCFGVDIIKGTGPNSEGTYYESGSRSKTTGKLTIKKNGGNYSVSLSGVAMYQESSDGKSQQVTSNLSFTYNGTIIDYPWKYNDEDK